MNDFLQTRIFDLEDVVITQKNEIERLRDALEAIKSEAEQVRYGQGKTQHLIRCIHVQVASALSSGSDIRKETDDG